MRTTISFADLSHAQNRESAIRVFQILLTGFCVLGWLVFGVHELFFGDILHLEMPVIVWGTLCISASFAFIVVLLTIVRVRRFYKRSNAFAVLIDVDGPNQFQFASQVEVESKERFAEVLKGFARWVNEGTARGKSLRGDYDKHWKRLLENGKYLGLVDANSTPEDFEIEKSPDQPGEVTKK